MSYSTRLMVGIACCALAGCIATTKDGSKPLKQESQEVTAS